MLTVGGSGVINEEPADVAVGAIAFCAIAFDATALGAIGTLGKAISLGAADSDAFGDTFDVASGALKTGALGALTENASGVAGFGGATGDGGKA